MIELKLSSLTYPKVHHNSSTLLLKKIYIISVMYTNLWCVAQKLDFPNISFEFKVFSNFNFRSQYLLIYKIWKVVFIFKFLGNFSVLFTFKIKIELKMLKKKHLWFKKSFQLTLKDKEALQVTNNFLVFHLI